MALFICAVFVCGVCGANVLRVVKPYLKVEEARAREIGEYNVNEEAEMENLVPQLEEMIDTNANVVNNAQDLEGQLHKEKKHEAPASSEYTVGKQEGDEITVCGGSDHQARESEQAFGECSICMSMPADVILAPCGHRCICSGCLHKLDTCPVCGSEIQSHLKNV